MAMNFSVMNNLIIIIGSSFEPNHNFGFLSSQSQNSSPGKFSCKNKIRALLRVQFPTGKYDDEVKIVKLTVWILSEYVHMYTSRCFRLANTHEIDI